VGPRGLVRGSILLAGVVSALSAAAGSGQVFEDLDGDGVRGPHEPGVPGVVVSRGAVIVRADATGRYVLPDEEGTSSGFVVLTRPDGFDCARWYRTDAGDFALRRRPPDGPSFVFAHVSDVHLSNQAGDFARYGIPKTIAAAPLWLSGRMIQLMLSFQNPDYSSRDGAQAVRDALSGRIDTSGMSDARVMGEWVREIASLDAPDPILAIDPVADFDASLEELRALSPRFVVSTGDFVLESNKADAATVDRWMHFYRERTGASGLEFYDTIGNNEIAGTENPDFRPGDPGYGKVLFEQIFGPTHYSFDRGAFHFIALDTHAAGPADPEKWRFDTLAPGVRSWLEADLAMHAGRPIVVLNHEPLVADRRWTLPMRLSATVDEDVAELLEGAGVRWTLSGHVHVNGERRRGGTQHIVTGALSGSRWIFPPRAFARGYRLVQVRDGELYSVWKPSGAPQVAFVEPAGDPAHHATHPRRPQNAAPQQRRQIVVAAVDVAGPFARVVIRLDGRVLPQERWSPYFAAASYDPAVLAPGTHTLGVEASRSDGSVVLDETQIEVAER